MRRGVQLRPLALRCHVDEKNGPRDQQPDVLAVDPFMGTELQFSVRGRIGNPSVILSRRDMRRLRDMLDRCLALGARGGARGLR